MSRYLKHLKLWCQKEESEYDHHQLNYERPLVTVDLIGLRFQSEINQMQILLIQRQSNSNQGKWSLPGGLILPNETTYDAVKREVREKTNVNIKEQRIQLLPLVSTPHRDPHMWVMANPNIVLFTPEDQLDLKAGNGAQKVCFFNITTDRENKINVEGLSSLDLILDHYKLITSAIKKLQVELERKRYCNVLPMLPKQFVLTQALALFQAIDYPRFKSYDNSNIKRILKNTIKQVSTVRLNGIRKPIGLFEFEAACS